MNPQKVAFQKAGPGDPQLFKSSLAVKSCLQKLVFYIVFHSKNINHLAGLDALDFFVMKNMIRKGFSKNQRQNQRNTIGFAELYMFLTFIIKKKHKQLKNKKKLINLKTLLVSSKRLWLPELNGVRGAWERPTRSLVVQAFYVFELFFCVFVMKKKA